MSTRNHDDGIIIIETNVVSEETVMANLNLDAEKLAKLEAMLAAGQNPVEEQIKMTPRKFMRMMFKRIKSQVKNWFVK